MARVRAVVLPDPALPLDVVRRPDADLPRRATASTADFEEATQLADNADVRDLRRDRRAREEVRAGRRTRRASRSRSTTRYAPIPQDTRAILRQKTLLGETYVELTPGDRRSPATCPTAACCRATQIRPTVELDEILRALDEPTRDDLQRFLKGTARAFEGRGEDLNAALGNLRAVRRGRRRPAAGARHASTRAVRRLVSRQRPGVRVARPAPGRALGARARAATRVLGATARRNAELAETVRILPTTLRELRPTLAEVEASRARRAPLVRDLRPAARALGPTLADAAAARARAARRCSATSTA